MKLRKSFLKKIIIFLLIIFSATTLLKLNLKNVNTWIEDIGFVMISNKTDRVTKAIELYKHLLYAPSNWLNGDSLNLPTLQIDIKHKNIEKIRNKRNEAIKTGIQTSTNRDFVTALITHNGKSFNAKLRLKGDWVDHLKGNKWSFRVVIKDSESLFGIRRFSIQHPKTRGYNSPILFAQTLRTIGSNILIPRNMLVKVIINGNHIGIMHLEEHFSKELLESQNRIESVILKFDESNIWDLNANLFNPIYNSYKNAGIDVFQ